MNWQKRFKVVLKKLPCKTGPLALIMGYSKEQLLSFGTPKNPMPNGLKLAIAFYEAHKDLKETFALLYHNQPEMIRWFIKYRLLTNNLTGALYASNMQVLDPESAKANPDIRSFDLKAVLDLFADLGIYRYTYYLYLQFRSERPVIFFQHPGWWISVKYFNTFNAVDIVYGILEQTLFNEINPEIINSLVSKHS